MSKDSAIIELPQKTDLALIITDRAVELQKQQREMLKSYVKSQLVEGIDYGIIPGCKSPSLYKPGAEKIANIFQLACRIVSVEKDLDLAHDFAMYTYTIEMYHLPSGKAVSQCSGSVNSQEKKYRNVRAADVVNTLQKMAQKRAYVGAVIIATGASDFFTQDMEDINLEARDHTIGEVTQVKRQAQTQKCECGAEMMISKYDTSLWYCQTCKAKVPRQGK